MPTLVEIAVLLLIGVVVGFIADTLTPGRVPFGWLLAMILGILGSAVGGYAFADAAPLGLVVDGFAVVPAIVGAAVLVVLAKLLIVLASRRPRS